MTHSTTCSICQRQNKAESTQCAYCGTALRPTPSGFNVQTALNMATSAGGFDGNGRCPDHLPNLNKGDICFVFEKKKTPVILRSATEILLGRFLDGPQNETLDLDPYDGGAFGVSRKHARIVRIHDKFALEDLDSTNGSWLNGKRLPAGTPFPLQSGDQIWLGQFKLQVCFHQEEGVSSTVIFLQEPTVQSKKLTPDILLTQYAPYLKTISDLQEIAAVCLQLESSGVVIEKMDASGSDAYVIVHISNQPEAIHLIRKWIMPWRREHQNKTDGNDQAMVQLTSKIIADIAPNLTNETRFRMVEQTLPIIKELATSSIELSFEAL